MRRTPARSNTRKTFKSWVLLLTIGLVAMFLLLLLRQLQTSKLVFRQWRTNIVLHTSPTIVISLPGAADEKTMVVTLPDSVYVDVPYGYGAYRLDKVWKLGELENRSDLFTEAIADLLAVPIHGSLGIEDAVEIPSKDTVILMESLRQVFGVTNILFSRQTSSFNLLDRIKLVSYLKGFRSENILVYNAAANNQLFVDDQLPDGIVVKKTNLEALNVFFEQKFESSGVRKDNLSVEIRNTTSTSGVGQQFSRYISNLGGKVITLGNEATDIAICGVETNAQNKSKALVLFLEKEFKCQIVLHEETGGVDVIVRLGKMFSQRW